MRHSDSPSSSIIQRGQWKSLWACTVRDQEAVFSLSNGLQRIESHESHDKRVLTEDHGIAFRDIKKPRNRNNSSTSASSAQKKSNTHKLNDSNKDYSQDQSNTNKPGIDTQNVRGDRGNNAEDDRRPDLVTISKRNTTSNADIAKAKLLIGRIESFKYLQENELQSLPLQWSTLWDEVEFKTSVQWHFTSLIDTKEKSPIRAAIHKWSLYKELERRLEQGTLGKSAKEHRDDMLRELQSSQALTRVQRRSKHHLLSIYLRHGTIFQKMLELCSATIMLVAPYLTRQEYDLYSLNVNLLIFQQHYNY